MRGDLIRILGQLLKRRDRFDYVLIETTGMADPGPVAQTFFLDEDLREQFVLDAIVTVVDARHIEGQLEEMSEPAQQIAFADVVLLNKTDLADDAQLARIERRIRAMNAAAQIHRTQQAQIDVDVILGLGAFDLARALATDASFLEPQYPFEWAGVYRLPAGDHVLNAGGDAPGGAHDHDHDHHDHDHDHDHEHHGHEAHDHGALRIALLPAQDATAAGIEALLPAAERAFAAPPGALLRGGERLAPGESAPALQLGCDASELVLHVPREGSYAIFCEHAPAELGMRVAGYEPVAQRQFASHHHDSSVRSIGIRDQRPLDARKVDEWFSYLLQSRGQDIFRMKGVLNMRGEARRYVFHGVHMMFDGREGEPWGSAQRASSLIFIGRDLDREELLAGFESCVAG